MAWEEKKTMDGMAYYLETKTKEVSWFKPEALMTAEEIEENKGEWVWVPHPTDMWQAARVVKRDDDGTVHVRLEDNSGMKIPPSRTMQGPETRGRKQVVPLWELKKGNLKFLEDDLVMLDPVNEAFIIRNLARRYADGTIYTWVGAGRTVLVSVNPYKDMKLYTQEVIDLHRNKPPNKPIPPHVFDIANDSYDSMAFEGANQSVLISGESGAGKTEATKQCLQYLAAIADSDTAVEDKILVANPLLEAFGNAKTIRNINSSRFGKWMEVYFDKKTTKMSGAKIINYLLERSRVVHQQKDERNFHIFYELCFTEKCKDMYNLTVPEDYRYLSQSGCVKVPQIDDEKEFVDVVKAMVTLEFSEEEQEHVLQLTAAVLWLGNVEFEKKMEKGSVEGSKIKAGEAAKEVSKLLEIDPDKLAQILCYRTIRPRGGKDSAVIPLAPKDARTACDSLAMGVYGKLFSWLVSRVNQALGEQEGRFIGILDIFGFEIFENNSFEQLCINYANEKLQQLFNRTTFKEEEELYKAEGVQYTPIQFIDNQPVLDLVEKKPHGILPVLDDECLIPEGSDLKFMKKIESYHAALTDFQTDTKRKFESNLSFEIKHYAGIVRYDASMFMTKNLDTVYDDMHTAMRGSDNDLLKTIFKDSEQRIKTLSYQFRGQLTQLMDILYTTESRFIRCIKPNDELKPNKFISSSCIEQLRYSGVFEAVDIRKTGYPFRYTHKRFVYRYSCINQGYKYRTKMEDPVARIGEIFKASKQDFSGAQIGKSMVLYKANEYKLLKLLRNLALETIIPKQQAVIRGGITRTYFRVFAKRVRTIDRFIRKGDDYEGLSKAIDDAAPKHNFTVEQLRLFKMVPHNLGVAEQLKIELGEWLKIEKQMQDLKDKCESTGKPDKFYEDLKRIDQKVKDKKNRQETKMKKAKVDKWGRRAYIAPKLTANQKALHKEMGRLIHECILGQLDERIDKAIKNFDRADLVEALKKADELNHNTKRIDEGRKLIEDFLDMDQACQKAVQCVSRKMLEAALRRAQELKQDNEFVKAARVMNDLDEPAFVLKEYNRAKEVGDDKRRIHREIKLMDFKYENLDYAKFGVDALGRYRTPEEFAKAKFSARFFGAEALREGFKNWTTKLIPTSLIKPQFEADATADGAKPGPEDKGKIKNFKNVAKANFKSVLIYMGDKKHPDRKAAAEDILNRGIAAAKAHDDDTLMELYCQVIKQLTHNETKTDEPSDPRSQPETCTSYQNGLALLAMMLSVFPPCTAEYETDPHKPPTFDDAVVVWVLKNIVTEDRQRFVSALHNVKYGGSPRRVDDPQIIRHKFAELKGEFGLDAEKDSGPLEENVNLYLQ